jgi:hypothetical protein
MFSQFLVICGNKVLKRAQTCSPSSQNIYNIRYSFFIKGSINRKSFMILSFSIAICKILRALRALRAWVIDTNVEIGQQF